MKAHAQIKATLVILFLTYACYLGASSYQMRKLALPKHIVTLAAFDKQMPKPVGVAIFRLADQHQLVDPTFIPQNKTFILLQGPRPGFPAFPSGSSCYIFDGKGNLVDWTIDAGDDGGFVKRWLVPRRIHHRKVSMQQALQFAKQ